MKQISLFDEFDNYKYFINELVFLLNHYKNTKAVYSQQEISDYIFFILKKYNLYDNKK